MKFYLPFYILLVLLMSNLKVSAQNDTLVGWNFPNNPDDNIADVGITANINKTISNNAGGTTVYNVTGVTTFAVSNSNWTAGNGTKWWEIEFSTQGYDNVTVQSKQRASNTGPRDFKLQYKLGAGGTWTDIPGATILDSNDWVHGVLPPTTLPSETFDQASVYVRWIMTSDIASNGTTVATAGTSRIDDIYVKGAPIVAPEAEILTFTIPNQVSSVITSNTGTVDVVMPFGTNLTSLIPTITLSVGATISPLSGVAQDFSSSVIYVVTASDGTTTKNWTVNVSVLSASTEAEILTFDIPSQVSSNINSLTAIVDVVMPLGTNVTSLIPNITTSLNSTISPNSGIAQDFTNPFIYVVTAEDGTTTKNWTVNVVVQANNQAEILTFNIPNQVSGVLDGSAATISIVMPFGTDVTNLVPALTISQGATITPLNGVAQDFTNPVIYVVTAEDGIVTKNWTAAVTVEPGSSAAEILTFDLSGQTSSVVNSVNGTVDISMPAGSDVTNLSPTITISPNATISPNDGVNQNFTSPIIYVVTAEDGTTTKNWTVTVLVEQTTIVNWNFPNNPDDNIADGGITANLSKVITTNATGTITYANTGATTNAISSTGWDAGMDLKYWEIEFTTQGYTDINLSSKQRSSGSGPKDWKIQYKIGNSGIWTDVPGANIIDSNDWVHGIFPETILPSETFDQSSVYIRWIMTSDIAVNLSAVGAAGTSRIDDIIVKGNLITSSLELSNLTFDFTIFPNPASDFLRIICNQNDGDYNVELITVDGKSITKRKTQNNILYLHGIEPGMYFIKVGHSKDVRKIIVK